MTDLINLLSWRQWAVGSVAVLIVVAALIYVYLKDRREDLYLKRRGMPLRDPGPTLSQKIGASPATAHVRHDCAAAGSGEAGGLPPSSVLCGPGLVDGSLSDTSELPVGRIAQTSVQGWPRVGVCAGSTQVVARLYLLKGEGHGNPSEARYCVRRTDHFCNGGRSGGHGAIPHQVLEGMEEVLGQDIQTASTSPDSRGGDDGGIATPAVNPSIKLDRSVSGARPCSPLKE